jgi:8-oxo-dGTP pyrophosphatase MutT (NUDIX family)
MIEPWRAISSRPLGDFRVFSVREERRKSPRTSAILDFFILDAANWVNVIALTPDGQMVLIEQYRHGSNTVELEIPGGVMDPTDLSPQATGCRELVEETGYAGDAPQIVGQVFPNPAIMSNTCYTVLLRDCRQIKPVQLDQGEDLATRLVPVAEVPELVASGLIRHSLIVAALYQFELWSKRQGTA